MINVKRILDLGIIDKYSVFDSVATAFPSSDNTHVQNDFISEVISTSGVNKRESDLKKLFTAATKIAQEKGIDGFPKIGNLATAVISDNVFTVAKASYLLANGEISTDTVAEIVADKAAVACDCIASFITPETIKLGLDRLVDVISIATSHPEMQALKSYTAAFSHWIAPSAQNFIMEGKKILSTAIRTGLVNVSNWLQRKVSKIASLIPLWAK